MRVELSEEEKDILRKLGSDSDDEFVPQEMIDQLVSKGMLCIRASDGHYDFTDDGEIILEELIDDGDN